MCRRQPGIGKFFVWQTWVSHWPGGQLLVVCARNAMENGASAMFDHIISQPLKVPTTSPVCDSYVRPETLVRICDECNFGTYGGRCIICGSPGEPFSHPCLVHLFNTPARRNFGCLLLRWMYEARERSRRVPEDCQSGCQSNRSLLWATSLRWVRWYSTLGWILTKTLSLGFKKG